MPGPDDSHADFTDETGPTRPTWTHVALPVSNLDASLSWYESFTPLRTLARRSDDAGESAWIGDPASTVNPFILVLVSFNEAQSVGPHATLAPFAHLGFELPSAEAVDAAATAGAQAGCLVWQTAQMPPPIGYVCALADPDGNVVEFSFGQGVIAEAQRVWGTGG